MKSKHLTASQLIQSNRHLKEWSNQVALEVKEHYALGNRHKQETSRLLLEAGSCCEQALLATRQAEELHKLKDRHGKSRIAIQERHAQEVVDLNQNLGQSLLPAAYRWDGVHLRKIY